MSTSTNANPAVESGVETRVLNEGYGTGSWHGPDLRAALGDVENAMAFWRPAPGRHNIAEIALHHAYCTHALRTKISGRTAEPFVMDGEDWFEVNEGGRLSWSDVRVLVETEQLRLTELIAAIQAGTMASAVPDEERFGLVLGITCHAVYHAGQVQLIRRLYGA